MNEEIPQPQFERNEHFEGMALTYEMSVFMFCLTILKVYGVIFAQKKLQEYKRNIDKNKNGWGLIIEFYVKLK